MDVEKAMHYLIDFFIIKGVETRKMSCEHYGNIRIYL